ncbi:MAG: amino acid adenylation domain-containing protein [Chitinophagaceae bacterium]|nr:amino acid adenylation domain-containing protein [Chitinophagaceae bacterium]
MTMYKDPVRDKFVEEYWYKKLSEPDHRNVFFSRIAADTAQREHLQVLSERAIQNLDHLAKGNESGKLVVCLALFSFLVHKYFQVKKFLIYSPAMDHPGAFFPQHAPFFLRLSIDPEISFKQLIVQVSQEVQESAAHGNYSFQAVKGRFADRQIDGNLVQSLGFYYAPAGEGQMDTGKTSFLLGINHDKEGGMTVHLRSRTGILSEHAEKDLVHRFHRLLNELPGVLDQPLKAWEWLTDHERREILFPEELSEPPALRGIPTALFEEQAVRSPGRIALHDGQNALTYGSLNRESNRLAHYLREQAGVAGQDIVLTLLDRSLDTGIAIWGILKAGGVLLQADPDASGIGELLKDVRPKCIITQMRHLEKLDGFDGNIFAMDVQMASLDTSFENPSPVNSPGDMACIVYTAGTGGRAKGVPITHSAVCGVSAFDTLLSPGGLQKEGIQMAVVSASVTSSFLKQFFWAHLTGHTLYIVPQGLTKDPDGLWKFYSRHKIGVTDTYPSLLNRLAQVFPPEDLHLQLDYWIVRGDRLSHSSLVLLGSCFTSRGVSINVLQEYSVTECFSDVVIYPLDSRTDADGSSVARTTPGTQVLILDEDLRLVPAGVNGQIALSGMGGWLGYINDPETTASRFIKSPFSEWDRSLFLTGDRGLRLPDGSISFTGRLDRLIQIEKHTIDLDAIETELYRIPGIREVKVVWALKEGGYSLIIYWTGEKRTGDTLTRKALSKQLASETISGYYVALPFIPVTAYGKVDTKALPEPSGPDAEEDRIVPPRNSMEELLLGIWQKTLRNPDITIFTDFFLKGGDSIKAIQISSLLYGSGYKMLIRDIFQYPTVARLAPRIVPLERETDQAPVTGEIPLTPIQRWFFSFYRNAPGHFNQSVLLRFNEIVDKQKVTAVFNKLQEHHDALRMTFRQNDQGDWIQYNNEPGSPLSLRVFDLRTTDDPLSVLARKSEEIQGSIQLDSGPLMKLGLFYVGGGSRLLIVIHHLVVDAVSFRILLEDISLLFTLYNEGKTGPLPVKTDSYKQWAQTLVTYADDARFLRERDHWEKLRDNLSPQKAGRGERQFCMKDTRFLSFELSQSETNELLGEANLAFNTDIQDLLIAAFLLAYKDTWKQGKLTLMLEGHGRESAAGDVNVTRTIGWFTSLFPVQFEIPGNGNPEDQIIMVKELLRKVPSKGIGYGIFNYLDRLPSVIFNYLGQFDEDKEEGIFRISDEEKGHSHSRETEMLFDLEVTGMVSDGKLRIGVTYPDGLYAEEEPAAFWNAYQDRILEITKYCSGRTPTRFTPSDFTYKGMRIEHIDAICHKFEVEDIYTLSPMQEGILFTCLYKEDPTVYFEQLSYRMRDRDLHPEWVRESLRQLMGRHAVLRTIFMYESLERSVQVVLREVKEDFLFEDLRGLEDKDAYVRQYKEKDKLRSFNLEAGMLLRVAVFRLNEEEFEFIWSHHHILMDAWCQGVMIREYYSIYNSLSGRVGADLPPVNPYRTYIQWLEDRDKELSREYWRNYLSSYARPAVLPKKYTGPAGTRFIKRSITAVLESQVSSMLHQTAARYQLTMNTLIQAAWGLVLAKYNNTRDVVFGSVVSGRPAEIPHVSSMVGLFINTIPVRVQFDQDTSFLALVEKLQQEALAGVPHHYASLAEIQTLSGLQQPIINHILLFDNFPSSEEQLHQAGEGEGGYIPEIYQIEEFEDPDYDLNIRVGADKDIVIRFDYNELVFDRSVLAAMLSVLETILRTVATDPQCNVSALEIVSPEEKVRLKEFVAGQRIDKAPGSIIPGFDEQAALHFNKTAVVFQDRSLTYGQLQERSEFLAQYLISRCDVKPGEIIAVMMNRSELPVIAVLGILKAGAAFVPIETSLPKERKAFILKDAAVRLILTESEFLLELSAYYHHKLVALDLLEFGVVPKAALVPNDPSRPAYIIYTSGSTGTPKGVCVEMKSLANYIYWANNHYFKDEKGHCFGLFTSMSFDLTITSLFSGLLRGDKLVVLPSDMEINDLFIYLFGKQTDINTVKITPSHVHLLSNLPILKTFIGTVILGGEKVTREQFETLKRLNPSIRIFNEYGPTEATVGCTIKEICLADEIGSIGIPIWNTEIYILDAEGNFQPMGTPGEIYIGGSCLSRGYLNRPELTAERYAPARTAEGRILYRTGDQAMWTTGGEIEFLGRLDEQLKIRGYRIEPGEIEKCIMQLSGVKAAVVISRQNREHMPEVVGYYTGDHKIPASSIRRQLSELLPEFMIPHHLLFLESFPLNSSGKVNKLALPFYIEGDREEFSTPPSNSIEERLSSAWQQLLGGNRLGVNDNFFNLGGDSIKIIRLYNLIKKEFTEKIKVSDLYDNPTIAKQAAIIALLTGKTAAANKKVDLIDF